jgi:hypothetical protein
MSVRLTCCSSLRTTIILAVCVRALTESFDSKQIEGRTICALGDAAAWPIQGLMKNFRA